MNNISSISDRRVSTDIDKEEFIPQGILHIDEEYMFKFYYGFKLHKNKPKKNLSSLRENQ